MQVKKSFVTDTQVEIIITADAKQLSNLKKHVLDKLGKDIKVPGFRKGKIPADIVEKNLNPNTLQAEFVDEAVNHMYGDALDHTKLRPVNNPEVSILKFVPFTEFEFKATVEVVGEVTLPDYAKIRVTPKPVDVTAKDIDDVIESLRARGAERKSVERAAKDGDELMIDFKGVDEKGKAIKGADGTDYPLTLGSKTFIPGFEEELIGLKPAAVKEFPIVFPKDYGVSSLQNKKVTFTVTVKTVNEMVKPKVDDDFAAKAGPFKTLKDLKDDIKVQLMQERQYTADRDLENDIIAAIATKTSVAIPQSLLDEQIEKMWRDVQQNLMYRGQTVQEFLAEEGKDEDTYKKETLSKDAEQRVKGGLILSEVAEKEQITVTPEELQSRLAELKAQYKDDKMQAELDNPRNQRDIVARILTEKTLAKLVALTSK